MYTDKKSRLGRGLEALLGEEPTAAPSNRGELSLESIEKSPFQPRKVFEPEEIQALTDSIRSHGILQPLVVRPLGDRYQLIAGERRLRAAEAAGLESVPVTIVDFNDQQSYEAALIENIQRSDLTPIEKALGFKEYLERYNLTHEQLAQRLGLARPTISNLLGLLDLPHNIQEMVQSGQLSMGHAKVLKNIPSQEKQAELAKDVVNRGLSVHALTGIVQELPPAEKPSRVGSSTGGGGSTSSTSSPSPIPAGSGSSLKTAHVQSIEDELQRKLGLKVEIKVKDKDRGQIILTFESNDDFERTIAALRG
jgi:ParB family chromosome partitioning protein